jgi:hypothetical protein
MQTLVAELQLDDPLADAALHLERRNDAMYTMINHVVCARAAGVTHLGEEYFGTEYDPVKPVTT